MFEPTVAASAIDWPAEPAASVPVIAICTGVPPVGSKRSQRASDGAARTAGQGAVEASARWRLVAVN